MPFLENNFYLFLSFFSAQINELLYTDFFFFSIVQVSKIVTIYTSSLFYYWKQIKTYNLKDKNNKLNIFFLRHFHMVFIFISMESMYLLNYLQREIRNFFLAADGARRSHSTLCEIFSNVFLWNINFGFVPSNFSSLNS